MGMEGADSHEEPWGREGSDWVAVETEGGACLRPQRPRRTLCHNTLAKMRVKLVRRCAHHVKLALIHKMGNATNAGTAGIGMMMSLRTTMLRWIRVVMLC